jgi:hypothetical protein
VNDPTVFGRDCFKLNCATTLFNQRDSAVVGAFGDIGEYVDDVVLVSLPHDSIFALLLLQICWAPRHIDMM